MDSEDPMKNFLLKIILVVIATFSILYILKPMITIAAGYWTCGSCDPVTFTLITALMFGGAVGIPLYKLVGIFYA